MCKKCARRACSLFSCVGTGVQKSHSRTYVPQRNAHRVSRVLGERSVSHAEGRHDDSKKKPFTARSSFPALPLGCSDCAQLPSTFWSVDRHLPNLSRPLSSPCNSHTHRPCVSRTRLEPDTYGTDTTPGSRAPCPFPSNLGSRWETTFAKRWGSPMLEWDLK